MTIAPSRPGVLILQPHLAFLEPMLAADYEVWRAWEGRPDEPHAIRALITAGEFAIDKALADALPNLSLIACFTSGYDGVDLAWAAARGLKVTHSPGVNHEDVADHALGLMLGAWRRVVEGDRMLRAGRWSPTEKMRTPSLGGRRVGVVGLGDIGLAIGRRCAAFGLSIAWWGPREKPDAPWPRAPDLLTLARDSDILFVACRATPRTTGLIDADVIAAVGPEGLVINVSRGQVVDEDALIAALKSGRLGAAALDVYRQEPTPSERWADTPNTVLTPHTAGATAAAVPKMTALTLETLRRHFNGQDLPNLVAEQRGLD